MLNKKLNPIKGVNKAEQELNAELPLYTCVNDIIYYGRLVPSDFHSGVVLWVLGYDFFYIKSSFWLIKFKALANYM